jgi:hypothetical protein
VYWALNPTVEENPPHPAFSFYLAGLG